MDGDEAQPKVSSAAPGTCQTRPWARAAASSACRRVAGTPARCPPHLARHRPDAGVQPRPRIPVRRLEAERGATQEQRGCMPVCQTGLRPIPPLVPGR